MGPLWSKRKVLVVAIVAALLLAMVSPFTFFYVRKRVRRHRSLKAFNARQLQLRKDAGRRLFQASKRAQRMAAVIGSNDPDSKIVLKAEHPESLQDEKNLRGRTLWVDAGGQLDYYRYNGRSIDFSHSEGVLLGAEKLLVRDAVQQPVPESAEYPIPRGDAQILLIFTLPGEPASEGKEFAVAVGDKEGDTYNILTDQIMFYEDPHIVYASWAPEIWKAIDEHRVMPGMTERQVRLALGEVSTPRADIMGVRQVEFDNLGHPMLVTFGVDKKAPPPQVERVTKIVDETL